jgi:hypothetical protein
VVWAEDLALLDVCRGTKVVKERERGGKRGRQKDRREREREREREKRRERERIASLCRLTRQSDMADVLERDFDYRNEHFEFIQMHLRCASPCMLLRSC